MVKNIPTASPVPAADTAGHTGRSAMSSPTAISTAPSSAENAVTLKSP